MTERGTALLDVNVLVALVWDQHVHHISAHENFEKLTAWATTPVTELGLVRVLLTPAAVGREVLPVEATGLLRALRGVNGWTWMPDDASFANPAVDLRVLMGRRQVTDLHLVDLAKANNAQLMTFDAALRKSLAPADRDVVVTWS